MKHVCVVVLLVTMFGCQGVRRISEQQKSDLREELKTMVKTDQIAANRPQFLSGNYKNYTNAQWEQYKDSVFTSHKNRLEVLFGRYGFPGYDKVGADGSKAFWLMVQHCDKFPDFQRKVLKSMNSEVKKNNANPENYAYLYDRVKVNAKEKQMFGTQVNYLINTTGRAVPKIGLSDSLNVDQHRLKHKLVPLKEYLNQMTRLHYDMNKAHYEKMGIMQPDLYP